MGSWGQPLFVRFTLVVYFQGPIEMRRARLERREAERFGSRIRPGGDMHRAHLDFLAWSDRYDQGVSSGRSSARHEEWMATLTSPVPRLDGRRAPEDLSSAIATHLTAVRD